MADVGTAAPASKPSRKPLIGLAALVLVGAGYAAYLIASSRGKISTDDAYVTRDLVIITPQIPGHITKILVEDQEVVKEGQELVELDDASYATDLKQSQANLEVAIAAEEAALKSQQLTEGTSGAQVAQALGGLNQAESAIVSSKSDVIRSDAAVKTALANHDAAEQLVLAYKASVDNTVAALAKAKEQYASSDAQLRQAEDGVRIAQSNLASAAANAEKATKDEKRNSDLLADRAISLAQFESSHASAVAAQATLAASKDQLQQAKALVDQRAADRRANIQQIESAKASVDQAKAQLANAQSNSQGIAAAVNQNKALLENSRAQVKQAEARRNQARGVLSQANTRPAQLSVAAANYKSAQARTLQARAVLETSKLNLARTKIFAPVGGRIGRKTAQVGQQVTAGQSLMAVVREGKVWIVANFKETDLKGIKVGARAQVETDKLPGKKFSGRVVSMAGGTGSVFTLLPPDNATGNFVKVVQRVPVKIVFDSDEEAIAQLQGGLSVTATVFQD